MWPVGMRTDIHQAASNAAGGAPQGRAPQPSGLIAVTLRTSELNFLPGERLLSSRADSLSVLAVPLDAGGKFDCPESKGVVFQRTGNYAFVDWRQEIV